jgi:hypothetical protein
MARAGFAGWGRGFFKSFRTYLRLEEGDEDEVEAEWRKGKGFELADGV